MPPFRRTLLLLVSGLVLAIPAEAQVRLLHVDPGHARASDNGPGSADRPLRTLQAGLDRALVARQRGHPARVLLHPGVYRESARLAPTDEPHDGPAPLLSIEAVEPGAAILTGADVWADWREEQPGVWSHAWPFDWGMVDDPSYGARYVAPIVRRRELLVVDGERLVQVEQRKRLAPGTFWLDERDRRVWMVPPGGRGLTDAVVEVAVRDRALWLEHVRDVVVTGLHVRHVATPWRDGWSAVRLNGGTRIRFEELTVRDTNGTGLWIGMAQEVQILGARLDHNGWDGLRLWRTVDVTIDSSTTNQNNWRGDLGDYHGWSVGNKIHETHGLTIRNHEARGNHSRGLWLDEDNRDVRIESSDLSDNLTDGLFIEANPGPVHLTGLTIARNGGFGIRIDYSSDLRIHGNRILDNAKGGLEIMGGPAGRDLVNFQTGEPYQARFARIRLESNELRSAPGPDHEALLVGRLPVAAWDGFMRELTSADNEWIHGADEGIVRVPESAHALTLPRWRAESGQDQDSRARSLPPGR